LAFRNVSSIARVIARGTAHMTGERDRSGDLAGMALFCFGLALIVGASVLNMVRNQLGTGGPNSPLRLLTMLYANFGTLGVTLALVGLGVVLIFLSGALKRERRNPEDDENEDALRQAPMFYAPPDTPPATTSSRGMVLTTRKYLRR
jgi:hypothetical protein